MLPRAAGLFGVCSQLACLRTVRRRCSCLHRNSLSNPPPLIHREAQWAARSRARLFVRAGDACSKRASAHEALMRMNSVVLTWCAGKPRMRAHPFPLPNEASRT